MTCRSPGYRDVPHPRREDGHLHLLLPRVHLRRGDVPDHHQVSLLTPPPPLHTPTAHIPTLVHGARQTC